MNWSDMNWSDMNWSVTNVVCCMNVVFYEDTGVGSGGASAPQNFWFGENPGKIT